MVSHITKYMAKITEIALLIAFMIIIYLTASLSSFQTAGKTQNNTISSRSSIRIPVMNTTGKARLVDCSITIIPGTGKLLVNIKDSYIDGYDTQPSIKTAALAAEKLTGVSLDNCDTIISFAADSAVIKGNSLGAPLAVAIVAAIKNKEIDPTTTITGTIHKDGTIGRVAGILEKAKASKEQGIRTLLVPDGTAIHTAYTKKKQCNDSGTACTTSVEKKKTDISKEAGIKLIETNNLGTAIVHMLR